MKEHTPEEDEVPADEEGEDEEEDGEEEVCGHHMRQAPKIRG